jgi:hypothetical protein
LAVPALTLHEVHIDASVRRVRQTAVLARTLAGPLRRAKPLLAPATNLSRQSSPCRRSSFSAHEKDCTVIFAFCSPNSNAIVGLLLLAESRDHRKNSKVLAGIYPRYGTVLQPNFNSRHEGIKRIFNNLGIFEATERTQVICVFWRLCLF